MSARPPPPVQPLLSRGLSDAISLYLTLLYYRRVAKPYLLVGLFTLDIIHFHLCFLTK